MTEQISSNSGNGLIFFFKDDYSRTEQSIAVFVDLSESLTLPVRIEQANLVQPGNAAD